MKKILLFFIVFCPKLIAQISINPASVGIGTNTLPSIPLHITLNSGGGIIQTESPKSYLSLSQYANPSGTINTIYHDGINADDYVKIKSASNIFTFYTLDQEQGRLDLNTNRFILQKEATFDYNLTFGGAFRFNSNAGLSGDLMTSLGNGTPAWANPVPKQPVGFGAYKIQANINPNVETDIVSMVEEYDNEGSLNFFPNTGAFIAPTDGVYHFDASAPVINYSSAITNGKVTLYVKKNGNIVDTMLKSFSGYGVNLQDKVGVQLSVTLKLVAGDAIKFGFIQTNNMNGSIQVGGVLLSDQFSISGFKVY